MLAVWLFRRDRWVAGSFLLGWVFLFKETGALLVVAVMLGVASLRGWRTAIRVGVLPALFLFAYLIKNHIQYGTAFVTFQPWGSGDLAAGIAQLTVSGHRGLLTLAPVLGLAAIGWALVGSRRGAWSRAAVAAGLACALFFLLVAAWHSPGGGTGYGPRLLVPLIPAFALPLVLTWREWRDRTWYRVAFVILTAVGFAWQFVAATHPFPASLDITVREMVARFPAYFVAGLALGTVPGLLLLRSPPAAASRELAGART